MPALSPSLSLSLSLSAGVVQLVGSALQISPSPLLLTSLGGVAQDQDPEPLIFSCLEVRASLCGAVRTTDDARPSTTFVMMSR